MSYKTHSRNPSGETFDADMDVEGQYDLSQITLEPALSGSTITQHAPTDTAADTTADPSSGTHTHVWSRLTNGRLFQTATATATAGEGQGSHSHRNHHQSRRSRTATISARSLKECAKVVCAGCGVVAGLSAVGGLGYLFIEKIPEWADHRGPQYQICAPGGGYMNRTYGDPTHGTHGTTVCCQNNSITAEQEEILWDPAVLSSLVEIPGSPQGSRLNETYPDELPNHVRNYCRYNRTGTD